MKDNTAQVVAQMPVDVATFLLNEKRSDVLSIETRFKVNVLLVPNRHLETPNYSIERIRHDELNNGEALPASFQLVRQPDEAEPTRSGRGPRDATGSSREGHYAGTAGPTAHRYGPGPCARVRVGSREGSWLSRMLGWFRTKPANAARSGERGETRPTARARDARESRARDTRPRGEPRRDGAVSKGSSRRRPRPTRRIARRRPGAKAAAKRPSAAKGRRARRRAQRRAAGGSARRAAGGAESPGRARPRPRASRSRKSCRRKPRWKWRILPRLRARRAARRRSSPTRAARSRWRTRGAAGSALRGRTPNGHSRRCALDRGTDRNARRPSRSERRQCAGIAACPRAGRRSDPRAQARGATRIDVLIAFGADSTAGDRATSNLDARRLAARLARPSVELRIGDGGDAALGRTDRRG